MHHKPQESIERTSPPPNTHVGMWAHAHIHSFTHFCALGLDLQRLAGDTMEEVSLSVMINSL
jgi:hypothetical protein